MWDEYNYYRGFEQDVDDNNNKNASITNNDHRRNFNRYDTNTQNNMNDVRMSGNEQSIHLILIVLFTFFPNFSPFKNR